MLYLLHTHWLWFFGALALGIIIGWITYLRDAPRWTDRPVHVAIAAVTLGAIVAIAKVLPGRYGYWLELGVIFAVVYTIGCFIGWALRDLAEFTPAAARVGVTTAAAGSYLFRDAFAGTGTGAPYMRTSSDCGAPARQPLVLGDGALAKAPAPGGYTFPKALSFAEATTSQAAASPGLRRHWSWPRPAGVPPYVTPEFTGSKGGYIFPVAAAVAATLAETSRSGATRAGLYRHWSWRGADAAAGAARPATVAAGSQVAPVVPAEAPIPTAPSAATPASPASAQSPAVDTIPGVGTPAPAATPVGTPSGDTAPQGGAAPAVSMGSTGSAASAVAGGPPAPTGESSAASPTTGPAVAGAPASTPTSPTIAERAAGSAPAASASTTTPAGNDAAGAPAPTSSATDASASAATPSAAAVSPDPTSAQLGQHGGDAPAVASNATTGSGSAGPAAGTASPTSGPGAGVSKDPAATGPGAASSAAPAPQGQASAAPTPSASPASPAAAGGSPTTTSAEAAGAAVSAAGGGQAAAAHPANDDAPAAEPDGHGTATGSPSPAPIAATGPAGVPATPPTSLPAADAAGPAAPPTATTPAAAGLQAAPPSAPGQPATIAAVPGEDKHPGTRPEGLMTARDQRADDLKRIRGIGPQNEGRLHGLGIWHFDQIAGWTPENVRWVGSYLAFPGRIDREKWVEQAAVLAGGGDTEFSKRVRAGKVTTSHDDGSLGQSNVDATTTPRPPRGPRR